MVIVFNEWDYYCDEYASKYATYYDEDAANQIAANVYKDACNADEICRWGKKYQDTDYGGCYRVHNNAYIFFCLWCVLAAPVLLVDICRPCPTCNHNNGYFCSGDFWLLTSMYLCGSDDQLGPGPGHRRLIIKEYNHRYLWKYMKCHPNKKYAPLYILDHFSRWGIQIIFVTIYCAKFDYQHVGDFKVEWYELWSAVSLLMVTYLVQIIYSRAIPYNKEIEKDRIDRYESKTKYNLMYNDYGLRQDIIRIIFEYSDEYYDGMEFENSLIKELCICCGQNDDYSKYSDTISDENEMNLEMTIANEDHSDTEGQDLKYLRDQRYSD